MRLAERSSIDRAVLQQQCLQRVIPHGGGDDEVPILLQCFRQSPVLARLGTVRLVIDNGPALEFRPLDHIVPGQEVKKLGI